LEIFPGYARLCRAAAALAMVQARREAVQMHAGDKLLDAHR